MPYSKKTRVADVIIHKFSNKGHGVGTFQRPDGTSSEAEISFAIPGDHIQAVLNAKKKGRWIGGIQELKEPSADRMTPRCVHFGVCGGCRWQQMSYETQLKYKESMVKELFHSYLNSETDFRPIIGSDSPWHYRNKMEFSFSSDLSKNQYLGLIKDSSKGRVLNLTECHLVNEWYIAALDTVRRWWQESGLDAYHPGKNTGSLRTLTVRQGIKTGDRMVILTVSGNPDFALNRQQLDHFVAALRDKIEPKESFQGGQLSIFLCIQQIAKGMPTNFYEMLLYGPDHIVEYLDIQIDPLKPASRFKFVISPSAFFQPNIKQAEKFYSLALQLSNVNKETVVYDLFCGTGTIGICASRDVKSVIGIELSPEASLDARQNATLNKCDNVTILTGSVGDVLNQMREENKIPPPDVAIIDPPRSGLDPKAIQQLLKLNPPKILFISCNPYTQAANVAELIKNDYEVVTVQPFDQFPHTVHIENIVLLERVK